MAVTSHLVAHRGAALVARSALPDTAPPATESWFPVPHLAAVQTVEEALANAQFEIRKQTFALTRDASRLFATIDLATPLAGGEVTLAVGIRNSTDKSLPLGFCAGSRVFVCDNLAFRSELLVARKHTRFGMERFQEAICKAVQQLGVFQESERERIRKFAHQEITSEQAESVMLRSYERDIISHRLLPRVIREWRAPSFEEFAPRTFWSLENAFTTVLGEVAATNPQRFCALSIRLQGLLSAAAGIASEPQFTQAV